MRRDIRALAVVSLIALIASLLWVQQRPATEEIQGPGPAANDRPRLEVDASDGLLTPDQAARLSPRQWTPPAEFSRPAPAVVTKTWRRGANAMRYHESPVTHEVDPRSATDSPRALAGTPEDGRFYLLPGEIDLHTLIGRRMAFDPSALESVIAGGTSRIIAPTTGDEVLTLDISSFKTRSPQSHTLFGRVAGEEATSDVQLVYHDGVIHGTVARYDRNQHLEYRILADGHMMVRELDQSSMTDVCGNGAHTEAGGKLSCSEGCSDCSHGAQAGQLLEEATGAQIEIAPQDAGGEVLPDTPGSTTLDVVVGYDQGARVADGGYSQIEARIISAVDRMTTAFANSQILNSEVNLLGTIEDPNYVFPGTDAGSMSSELGGLNSFSDGNLDTVSDLATQLGADFVAFVQKQADGSAGLAYRPGRASVTARDYITTTRLTFAHELGHNLGCDHSWGDSSQSYHTHYGWRLDFDGSSSTTSDRVRTIMAYDWGWGSGQRIPYYANPNVSYNGAPTGTVNGHDVRTDTKGDQRYLQNGLNYTNGVFGFDGTKSALAANNANTVRNGAGVSNYGVVFASNRSTRVSNAVVSPLATANWLAGSTNDIFFVGGDHTDSATLELLRGGSPVATIATGLNPATDRLYSWTCPTTLTTASNYQVRVTLTLGHGGTISFTSANFTITALAANTVEVISPNGGELIYTGQNREITWIASVAGNVDITLLKGGSPHLAIATNQANDGSYSWSVPGSLVDGVDYRIRVSSTSNSTYNDSSDADFQILQAPTLEDALDTSGITWTTSGGADWFFQTATTHDGIDAAQSGDIGDGATTSMEATLNSSGTLTFWWKVSSESSYDFLRFYLDGVEQTGSLARISGEVNWVQKSVSIPSGTHTVRWSYTKDGSVSSGSDCGWVDQVVFTPDAAGPEITVEQPAGTSLADGSSTVDFGSANVGVPATARTFTIRNDGTANLTGLALSKSGAHQADYVLGSLGATSLAPGASTTFTVTFTPAATGNRTASLQIASNDSNENPFDINLTGVGSGPAALTVASGSGLASSGLQGGPFSPSSIQYTLENTGGESLNWTVSKTKSWVTVSNTSGSLAAGASTTVTVSINADAATLSPGSYADTVTFTNTTNNVGNTTRAVVLNVAGLFTLWQEDFDDQATPPGGWIASTTTGSGSWTVSTTPANANSPDNCYSAPLPATKLTSHLVSPPIAIPADANTTKISFWMNYNLQNRRDGGRLQLSLDGGAWYEVDSANSGAAFSSGGYSSSTISGTGNPNARSDYEGMTAWTGNSGGYIQTVLELSDNTTRTYTGNSLRLRWTVATDSSSYSGAYWYLDDIEVVTDAAPSFTISYDGNDNTSGSVPANQTKTGGVALTLASNSGNLAKTGFGFAGWNTNSSGTGTSYAEGATFVTDADTLLYAKWNGTPVANAGSDQSVNLIPGGGPWTPADITTQLWLDADDAGTITLNAGLFQWADKSGNSRHATQGTASAQPSLTSAALGGRDVLTFDATDDLLAVDLDFLAGVSHSAFIVTKTTTYSNIYGAATQNSGANSLHVGFRDAGSYRMNYWANDWYPGIASPFVANEANLLNFVWTNNTSKQIYANAVSQGVSNQQGTIGTMAGGGRIGRTTNHPFYGGDIAEIVMITGAVDPADKERMEGYLAHKWGLQNKLPEGHAYKTEAPGGAGMSVAVDLSGATVTDPEGDNSTVTWSVLSTSPGGLEGNVSFDNANLLGATATFTAEGVYTLRLTANDPYSSDFDDVIITVGPAASPYQIWTQGAFANAFTLTGGNDDPDGDGRANFLEFAFGTDPTLSDRQAMSYVPDGNVTRTGLPALEGPSGGYKAVFTRRKNHVAAGLNYVVEFSADMARWTPSSIGLEVVTGSGSSGDFEAVRVPFPPSVPLQAGGSAAPRFFRVDVTME